MIRRVKSWGLVRVLAAYGESQASNYASALAFTCMLAMFPLVLGVLSLVGFAIRDAALEAKAEALIVQGFPGSAQPQVIDALRGVKQSAGWMGLLALAGLLWSASSIFSTMEFALSQIFGTRQRDMVRQKLMGLVMMVLLVMAVGITVAANTLAALFPFAWITGLIVGSAVMIGLLSMLYRFVPNRTFELRQVMPGAILAGIMIEIFSVGFPLYARLAGGFNTYGAQFGLFFLLAAWFYVVSELILFGAVFNQFRLGQPLAMGLIASPNHESKEIRRPVEVIKESQATEQVGPSGAKRIGDRLAVFRRRKRPTTM